MRRIATDRCRRYHRRCHRRLCLAHLQPRAAGVCWRLDSRACRLSRSQSDRRSGRSRQGRHRQTWRISRQGCRLHGLSHRAGRRGVCRWSRFPAAVRHALFDQHHRRQGHRHRQLQRSGFPRRRTARHPQGRRAALSGHALHVIHLHDRRRRAGDQGLPFQPARRARGRTSATRCNFPSTSVGR